MDQKLDYFYNSPAVRRIDTA